MREACVKTCVLGPLLALAVLLTSCEERPRTYSSYGLSVTFPGAFEVRESDEDTPHGKVHKTGAVCNQEACDLAFFTTTYPEALVKPYSDAEVLQKELDMSLRRLGAKLSSVQTEMTSSIPYIKFQFKIPAQSKSHGEGCLLYHGYKTFLISAIYAERTDNVGAFLDSIKKPGIGGAQPAGAANAAPPHR